MDYEPIPKDSVLQRFCCRVSGLIFPRADWAEAKGNITYVRLFRML